MNVSFQEWQRRLATRKAGGAESYIDEMLRDWAHEREYFLRVFPAEKGGAEITRLREALKAVAHRSNRGFTHCAMCDYVSEAGHREGCIVGQALCWPEVLKERPRWQ